MKRKINVSHNYIKSQVLHIGVKLYWNTLNKVIEKKKFVNILPILESGVFVCNLEAKGNLFNDYFVEQCCVIETDITVPVFRPMCLTLLMSVDVDRGKNT